MKTTPSPRLKQSERSRVLTSISYAERSTAYARSVVAGETLACEFVKQACRRHLDLLKESRSKACRWKYDAEQADYVCRFIEALPHTKDDFLGHASKGELLRLEPWQIFLTCNVFAWVDKKTGDRKYREVYLEVPRKNAKSTLAAAWGEYMFAADGEFAAEVYSGATSERQAWEIFRPARQMAASTPQLRRAFGIDVQARSLFIAETQSCFKPVVRDPGDGTSPSCALIDEYHEHVDDKLVSTMRTGMLARRHPLLIMVTTAGSDRGSPCYDKRLESIEVLAGRRSNDRLFCIIYTVDEGVDWKSELALRMANPNYGVSVNPETLLHDQQQAIQSAARQNDFKTKHLDLWVNADVAWMNMAKWDACADRSLKLEEFAGDPCIAAVDLASRTDTASTVKLFEREVKGVKHFFCFSRHYLNEFAVSDRKSTHYQKWADEGWLTVTPGDVTSYFAVAEDLVEDANNLNMRELVFDPFHAAPFIQILEDCDGWNLNVECVDYRNTVENMSAPMKELEALVLEGRFHFDGNPVLSWMVSNVVCHRDRKDNIYPTREGRRIAQKIDGLICLVMANGRIMAQSQQYTSTEVLVA